MPKDFIPKRVLSRDGALVGRTTGGSHFCRLEGCGGLRISVRWPDGKITYPCSKGMVGVEPQEGETTWQIQ